MKNITISMEEYFSPLAKTKPSVHVGSQNFPFWKNPEDQSWDGIQLAVANTDDVIVVRNIDKDYIDYWKNLMGNMEVINLHLNKELSGKYLSEVILHDKKIISIIKRKMAKKSTLMVFLPTELEQRIADKLGIPLHGKPEITKRYGTKSGLRLLAQETNLAITPGFVCHSLKEVSIAAKKLAKTYDSLILKHDASASGELSKKFSSDDIINVAAYLDKVSSGKFLEGKDVVVVEGWVKGKVSLCVHIEIFEDQEPIICAGWQQLIDNDGITFVGAGPLNISKDALKSLLYESGRLAGELKKRGAIGSYGPDYLVVDKDDPIYREDDVILVELNARIPYTAYPLAIVKNIRGKIGSGFRSQHVYLSRPHTFSEIAGKLQEKNLLISERHRAAKGIVPYNPGPLPWGIIDIVAMADTTKEANELALRARNTLLTST